MIVGGIEIGIGSAKDTSGIVGVKDIDDPIAIGIVVGHITIVGNEASCWAAFDRVGDQVVVAVEIQKIDDSIGISIDWNRADRSGCGAVCSIGVKDILQSIAVSIADDAIGRGGFG